MHLALKGHQDNNTGCSPVHKNDAAKALQGRKKMVQSRSIALTGLLNVHFITPGGTRCYCITPFQG
jgi:hypothetical protein